MRNFGTQAMPKVVNRQTNLDERFFNTTHEGIDLRIHALEEIKTDWVDKATEVLTDVGLERIDEVLTPVLVKVQAVADLGFLIGVSTTSVTLVVDAARTFVITAGYSRDLFAPSKFVDIMSAALPNGYATAEVTNYNRVTGELQTTIRYISGIAGAHADWTIGAAPGVVPAVKAWYDIVVADAALVAADKTEVAADKTATHSDKLAGDASAAAAAGSATAAAVSAAAAATFDPASYYTKTAADARYVQPGAAALTGAPTAPTAAPGTNTTQLSTTAFVQAAVAALVAASPAALDTLNELAAALGNDANFATTMTNALAAKAPLASPALTGTPTAPTAAYGTATTQIATTAFVGTGEDFAFALSIAQGLR